MIRKLLRILAPLAAIVTLAAAAPAFADDPVRFTGGVFANVPVTDACVTVFRADAQTEVATGCVDTNQQYSIEVEPGVYKLRVRAAGFPDQWSDQHSTWERADSIEVSTFGRLVSFFLVSGFADITGTIVFPEDGSPVENAVVTANSVPGGSQWSATTDAAGHYTIIDLAPGQYYVQIFKERRGFQYAYSTKVFQEAAIFDLADGQVVEVNDTLLPLGTVEVIMIDERNHKRLTRGCVSVHNDLGGQTCENVNGVFTVRNVPAEFYEVSANPEGTHWPATGTVEVQPGRTSRVTIEVERATAFVTNVREAGTGQPADFVCIQLSDGSLNAALLHSGCSDETGRLVIGPLSGTVRTKLFAVHPDDRYGAQWVGALGGTGDARKAVTFVGKADKATTIPTIKMDPPGSITGVTRDAATGNPLSRVCAFPFALASTLALDRQVGPHCSDTQGQYTITGLGPYSWPVLYVAPFRGEYAWQWSGDGSDRFAAQYLVVRAGQATTADRSMVLAGTISGRALTPAGAPAFANSVIARNARTGDLAGPPTTTTNFSTGAYRLRALAAQNVRIEYFITVGPTCWYNLQPDFAHATPVAVASGAETPNIDLVDCAPPTS
jgi:hypothetical protein